MKQNNIKRLYYSITEVSKITGIEPYTLRYWQDVFEQLHPSKNRGGKRAYTNYDIKIILQIKELTRNQRFTLEGAKNILRQWSDENKLDTQLNTISFETNVTEELYKTNEKLKADLREVKFFLEELLVKLS
ncbi:MAG: MerR family transcriptional regulator [Ignavibacteria bacterium]|nr:MerR family transcriptional regulator [Ignavibacteria bacterium]